jgi:type III pantothenate kinase
MRKINMLLVVDIGNTDTVLGVFQKKQLLAQWRLSSTSPRTKDECWILFKMWCQDAGIDFAAIQGAVISSVVPSLTGVFQSMILEHLDINSLEISSDTDTGLEIQYEIPKHVGADRICNAVAGAALYGTPVIVVDLGTATTFDVIAPGNIYQGGAIALGLTSASKELHRLAAKLPRVDLSFPSRVVGKSTEQSMQSGIMWGTVSMIDGMIDRIQNELQWKSVTTVATGGLSPVLEGYSERIEHYNSHLTLEGMRIIYNRLSRHP